MIPRLSVQTQALIISSVKDVVFIFEFVEHESPKVQRIKLQCDPDMIFLSLSRFKSFFGLSYGSRLFSDLFCHQFPSCVHL